MRIDLKDLDLPPARGHTDNDAQLTLTPILAMVPAPKSRIGRPIVWRLNDLDEHRSRVRVGGRLAHAQEVTDTQQVIHLHLVPHLLDLRDQIGEIL